MKKFLALALLTSFTALAAPAKKAEPATYSLDTASKVVWLGKKVGGEHTGNVNVKSGNLVFDNKALVSGDVEVDMTSITCTDLKDPEYNGKLVGHLKADDFFAADKFPTSTIKIKSAKKVKGNTYDVVGDLTIKGITNEVAFKADVVDAAKDVKVKAKVVFDRTKWKIEYKSGKIFQNLGDKLIYDDVELNVDLTAKK